MDPEQLPTWACTTNPYDSGFVVTAILTFVSTHSYAGILDFDDTLAGTGSGWKMGLGLDGYSLRSDMQQSSGGSITVTHTADMSDGQPHTVAAVFTGTEMSLYVDGVENVPSAVSAPIPSGYLRAFCCPCVIATCGVTVI
jgi:hypothetical protein